MATQTGRIYKERGNRWLIRLPGGLRIYCDKQHRSFYSEQHARWTLNQIQGEIENGTFDPDFYAKTKKSIRSFATYAAQWLQRCHRKVELGKLSKVHFRHLKHCVDAHFIPFFGETNMLDIKGRDINEFWLSLDGKAPKTVFNYLAALHRLFADAVRDEIIQQLPNFPSELKHSDLPQPNWQWASEETQEQIFEHLAPDDLYFILFQACHGTRTGETRALQHGDIDLKNDTVTIRGAFSERDLKEHTKTKKIRILPLDPVWKEAYLSRPRVIDPKGFVFTRNGKPYSTKWMWRRWCEACDKAGVSGLTLYAGTRHSLASQAANRGVSIYIIAKFLGHQDIKTSQRYAHLDTNPMRQVQRKGSVKAFSATYLQTEKQASKSRKS